MQLDRSEARRLKVNAAQRRYYQRHKEKVRAKAKENYRSWYEKNKQTCIDKAKAYYERNKEEIKEKRKQYYYANIEKSRKQSKESQRRRADKIRSYKRKKSRTLETVFQRARVAAGARGLEWGITIEQLAELRTRPCSYCIGPLPETGHGLDRVDNDRGYFIDNVIPCCYECNSHRGRTWTVEETKVAVRAVIELRGKNEMA